MEPLLLLGEEAAVVAGRAGLQGAGRGLDSPSKRRFRSLVGMGVLKPKGTTLLLLLLLLLLPSVAAVGMTMLFILWGKSMCCVVLEVMVI